MTAHFEMISEYCDVVSVVGDRAIFYYEDGFGYAEINGEMFSCDSLTQFNEMVELFGENDLSD